MEKIVITGGLGFLGQYTATSLIEKYPQAQVIILARSQRPVFLADIKNHPRLQIEYGIDLLKPETMEAFFANADLVVHGAAMVSFWRKDRKKMLEQNWGGTRVVLDLCKKNAVGKLVYISSTAAIGYSDDKDMPADENLVFDWSKAGKYAYAYSKYLAEQEVMADAAEGLPAVVVNPSSIYGPGDSKIAPLLDSIGSGALPAMMPGGLACVDVRDVASGIVAAAEKGLSGQRYILTGGNYSHVELISTIADVLGAQPPARTFSQAVGKVLMPLISLMEGLSFSPPKITSEIFDMGFRYRYFSIDKARKELGWQPKYDLKQTFLDIAEYVQSTKGKA